MSILAFDILYPLIMTLLVAIPTYLLSNVTNKIQFSIYFTTCYLLLVLLIIKNKSDNAIQIQIFLSAIYFYISNKNIMHSIITPLLVFFITAVSDTISGLFFMKVLNISYMDMKTNLNLYFSVGVLILFLTILISKLIQKVYLDVVINNIFLTKLKNYNHIMIFTSITITVLLLSYIFMLRFFLKFVNENFIALYTLSVFFFLTIFILVIYFALRFIKLSIKQTFIDKENKQLKEYSTMLENMSTDLRRFKHDYINILSTLGEFINEEDINGLKGYYSKELLPESEKIINRDKYVSLLKNIKITPLKALISSKIIYAQSRGIDTRVEILDEIDDLPIRTFDICRIIGIFLDNAIEATLLCDKKFIHLAFVKTDDSIVIIILNTCLEDSPPVYKIYDKDFSTKGTDRGIGLKTVKDMLNDSYKHILLNTTMENCIFKQEMIINKSDN
ncbi:GHKL domain-containing protein [Clostridium sp. HBUAS56017]|uniref:sensor histidine kinase n=1 Tax=Clostridium sp. HBUAS56017 TaxID=2571128 RepID=UPI001177BA7B|nr:GHKL domain-containing protein [Clostridium sp. HBUAS56017]